MGKSRHKQPAGCGVCGSGPPAFLASPCWDSPSLPMDSTSRVTSGGLLPVLSSPDWEESRSWMQACSHTAVQRSKRDPSPGGELSSQLWWKVRTGSCLSQCGGSSAGVIDGSDAELEIMLHAGSRAAGPREERCSPRSGWLAGSLAPTPGFMVLPLSGSL